MRCSRLFAASGLIPVAVALLLSFGHHVHSAPPAIPKAELHTVLGFNVLPAPSATVLAGDEVAKRLLLKIVRNRAVDRLVSHGLSDATGKPSKGINRAKARGMIDRIDNDLILKHIAEKHPDVAKIIGEGGRLEGLVKWLVDHKDEILALVKFIIALLLLLGDAVSSEWESLVVIVR